jgi:hypothetical protein
LALWLLSIGPAAILPTLNLAAIGKRKAKYLGSG